MNNIFLKTLIFLSLISLIIHVFLLCLKIDKRIDMSYLYIVIPLSCSITVISVYSLVRLFLCSGKETLIYKLIIFQCGILFVNFNSIAYNLDYHTGVSTFFYAAPLLFLIMFNGFYIAFVSFDIKKKKLRQKNKR